MTQTIKASRLAALSKGEAASKTLQEILRIDFSAMMRALAPDIALPFEGGERISRKMALCGEALLAYGGPAFLTSLERHPSDTVRGLAVFGLARHYVQTTILALLEMVRPFAADDHFGVREWAWLAVRPRLAECLGEAIAELAVWTGDRDVNLRRFAVEALRPRGVWCKHIAELRSEPALGLPLLDPMQTESEKYAHDLVGNWLNDAAKDNPDWVRALC